LFFELDISSTIEDQFMKKVKRERYWKTKFGLSNVGKNPPRIWFDLKKYQWLIKFGDSTYREKTFHEALSASRRMVKTG